MMRVSHAPSSAFQEERQMSNREESQVVSEVWP